MRRADALACSLVLTLCATALAQAPEASALTAPRGDGAALTGGAEFARRATLTASAGLAGSRALIASAGVAGSEAFTTPATDPPDRPARSARLLGESLSVAGVGLLLPMGTFLGATQVGRSFGAFLGGFLASTALGVLIAPALVALTHHLMGGPGGALRIVLGTLAGLLAGLLIGVPLATLPNAGAYGGLALAWTLPSVGTLLALELARPP
jgi:hypothetical protein